MGESTGQCEAERKRLDGQLDDVVVMRVKSRGLYVYSCDDIHYSCVPLVFRLIKRKKPPLMLF